MRTTFLALPLLAAPLTAQCEEARFTVGISFSQSGHGVAIEGDRALFGPASNFALSTGAARAYQFDGTSWVTTQTVLSSSLSNGDMLGRAIDIDGDTALIGAPGHDGVGSNSGAVYVFRLVAGTWIEEAELKASDESAHAQFGHALAIDGDLAVIGGYTANGATGVAYAFRRTGTSWTEEQKLVPSDLGAGDWLGHGVDVSGDRIVVGAPDHGAQDSGAAYVFHFDGGSWSQEAKLVGSTVVAYDTAGRAVAIEGDRAFVGAPAGDLESVAAGSVYVFERTGPSTWTEVQRLDPTDGVKRDYFGSSLAVQGDRLVVGCTGRDTDSGNGHGSAFLFRRVGGTWVEDDEFTSTVSDGGDSFGSSVDIDGDYVVAGAPQYDTVLTNVGASYVFDLRCDIDYYGCDSPPKSMPVISGRPEIGQSLVVGLTNTGAAQTAGSTFPFVALATTPDPSFPCGTPMPGWGIYAVPGELLIGIAPPNPFSILTGPVWAGFNQPSPVSLDVPEDPTLVGGVVFAQGFLIDVVGTNTVAALPGLRLLIGP